MGDNRPDSQDSRFFGVVDRELIVGRAWLRYFPLDRMGFVEHPTYAGLSTAGLRAGGLLGHDPAVDGAPVVDQVARRRTTSRAPRRRSPRHPRRGSGSAGR